METPFAQIETLAERLPQVFAVDGTNALDVPVTKAVARDVEPPLLAAPVLAEKLLSSNNLMVNAFQPVEGKVVGFSPLDRRPETGNSILCSPGSDELAVTPELVAVLRAAPEEQSAQPLPTDESKPDRWSMDGWLFLRQSSPSLVSGGVRPASYGGSQAGAVLRYRLAPGSGHKPSAYARATRNLRGVAETEMAAGFSARPIARLPIAAHAELRGRSKGGVTEVRPAAFVVSELPQAKLPLGVQAEAYVQAGYVGGDFATGFADGQIRASREVARFRLGSLHAGAGVWGGAQRGATRLDVGPSASVDFRIAEVNSRAQIDYRMRVAGDAEPGDGIAFTLSTGF